LVLNLEFLRFARHWGFTPRACRPYRAQTKGKIERPIFYVRDNFVYGRDFLGDGDLDEQRLRWLEQTANVRVHQTIMEQPLVRFERDERVHMKRLAEHPYQSLVLLDSGRKPERMPAGTPRIEVERRSLVTYARIAAGAR
jgi:hypothetical protein